MTSRLPARADRVDEFISRKDTDVRGAALRRSEAGDRSRPGERSDEIDGLRGVAALMVLVAHATLLAGGAGGHSLLSVNGLGIRMGVGVLLFFVLSGYLISGPFLTALLSNSRLPLISAYGLRRAARIMPAYWVALAVLLVGSGALPGVPWWDVFLHTTLVQGWAPSGSSLYFVAWSLSWEVAFYIFIPLAALALARRPGLCRLSRLAMLIGLLWLIAWALPTIADLRLAQGSTAATPPDWLLLLHNSPLGGLALFCPGMLIVLINSPQAATASGAWVVLRRLTQACISLPLALGLGAVGLLASSSADLVVRDVAANLLFSIAFGLLVAAVVRSNGGTRILRWLAPVGVISYGIYLWHWVVLLFIRDHAPELASKGGASAVAANIALLLAITLPLAIASWWLIERPAIHWAANRARVLLRRRGGTSVGSA
ncbi:MAG: acyltransferase [Thermoleophilaceae bacterium]|nr:acyltransferase [Thermoleophilaceae bacterium]